MIKSRKNIPIRAVFYVVILIFVMIQVYPIFWVICSSLKTPDEMTYTAQYALPSGFYLGNYISALTISSIPRYFLNSTVVAVLTLLGIVVLGCPVAFVISKVKVKYANVFVWNEFTYANTFISSSDMKTLPIGLNDFVGQFGRVDWGSTFAAIVISILPTLIVYFILNKNIIEGMAAGAVKS